MSQQRTQYKPTNCRKIKDEYKKDWFMKKKPASKGGGSIPKVKIKHIETYECDVADLVNQRIVKEQDSPKKKSRGIRIIIGKSKENSITESKSSKTKKSTKQT